MKKGFQWSAILGLTLLIALFLNVEAFAAGGDTTVSGSGANSGATEAGLPHCENCPPSNVKNGRADDKGPEVACSGPINGMTQEQSDEVQRANCPPKPNKAKGKPSKGGSTGSNTTE